MASEPQLLPLPSSKSATSVSREELERLKGQFLASLNHEIRTPLSGILGMSDLLMETALTEEQREYIHTSRDCANQLLDVLNSILAYSAIQAGNVVVESLEVPLRQILDTLAHETRAKAEAKGLEFHYTVGAPVPETVSGDARHLREALGQLLQNAVKFTSSGSIRLAVTTDSTPESPDPHTLRVRVEDTGIGIASEELIQIFESFHQLENGLSRSYSGLGLGLAISDKLARMMGGFIEVESQLGEGSAFTLALPIAEVRLSRPAPKIASNGASNGRKRILVVDDNQIAQQIVGHVLSRGPYEIAYADAGEQAVQLAEAQSFDLVLMDLQMPQMNGYAASDAIRRLPGREAVPIIAVSANYSDEHRELCHRHRMQGFVPKPIDRHALLAAVEKALH